MTMPTRRTRALVLAVGSAGDVAPMAAVADHLARTHALDTTLLAPARYAALCPAGVQFRSIGADDVFERVFDSPRLWTARHGASEAWRYYGAAALTGWQQIVRDASPDDTLLVSSTFAVAARLAEEAHGFLNTTVHLSPGVVFSYERPPRWPALSIPPQWPGWAQRGCAGLAERAALDPMIRRALAPAWQAAGLAPRSRLFSGFVHSPHRVAYLFPEWFGPAASDWPASGMHAGFAQPRAFAAPMTTEVERFITERSEPLAVVTAGTGVGQRPAWVSRSIEALLRGGARVLLLEPQATGTLGPDRLLSARFAPLRQVLPHAHLLLHHGGIGTAADAMRCGTPQWVFPSAHDQADNADRLQRMGVARVFRADAGLQELMSAWHEPAAIAAATLESVRQSVLAAPDGAAPVAHWVAGDLDRRVRRSPVRALPPAPPAHRHRARADAATTPRPS